jgi:Xaa-Pro aminopeptidase
LNIRGADIVRTPVVQGFAVLHADGRCDLFINPDKIDGQVAAHLGNQVTVHPPEDLAEQVALLDGPVLLDKLSCPLWFVEQFETTETEIVWGRDPCVAAKATKTAAELDGTRAAHLRDGAAMVRFLHWFDTALAAGETLTEIDVAAKLEAFRAEDPSLHDISFDTIAGSGPNGAIVHYRVNRDSNRTLVPGDLMLVDSGAQYPDGTTDITRTMATGPVTAEQRRHFTLVLKGMIAISMVRWPAGLRGRDLDALARAALWRAGLDYDHGTGHGVGAFLGVHEGPQNLSRRGEAVLEPGMILSNEPGYYVEGAYGIRIENLVIVTEPAVPEGGVRPMLGFETLTWCPIDRRLIDADLLTGEERGWLDAYHADVLARLGGAVAGDTLDWLKAACAPL